MTLPAPDADPSLVHAADAEGPVDASSQSAAAAPRELDEATRQTIGRKIAAGETPWSVQQHLVAQGFTEAAARDAVMAQPATAEATHRAAADMARERTESDAEKKAQAAIFGLQPWIESPLTFFGGAALVGLVFALTLVVNVTDSLGPLFLVRLGLSAGAVGLLARSFYDAME